MVERLRSLIPVAIAAAAVTLGGCSLYGTTGTAYPRGGYYGYGGGPYYSGYSGYSYPRGPSYYGGGYYGGGYYSTPPRVQRYQPYVHQAPPAYRPYVAPPAYRR